MGVANEPAGAFTQNSNGGLDLVAVIELPGAPDSAGHARRLDQAVKEPIFVGRNGYLSQTFLHSNCNRPGKEAIHIGQTGMDGQCHPALLNNLHQSFPVHSVLFPTQKQDDLGQSVVVGQGCPGAGKGGKAHDLVGGL